MTPPWKTLEMDLSLSIPSSLWRMTFHTQGKNLSTTDPILRIDNRLKYKEVSPYSDVMCATHSFGVQDKDSPEMWQEIITYLKMDIMPPCCENAAERKSFIQTTKNFFLYNEDCLWKIKPKGKIPHLVVISIDCC